MSDLGSHIAEHREPAEARIEEVACFGVGVQHARPVSRRPAAAGNSGPFLTGVAEVIKARKPGFRMI
ncbi:MAG: hypothetical protein ACE5E8_06630, partial [Acidimicrobiia bacterium]